MTEDLDSWDPEPDEINVYQIISPITQTEIVVPLDIENPESTMLRAAAEYLDQFDGRVPLLAVMTNYTQDPHPFLVATLLTGQTGGEDGPLKAMDQKEK